MSETTMMERLRIIAIEGGRRDGRDDYDQQHGDDLRLALDLLEECGRVLTRITSEHQSYDDPAVLNKGGAQYSIGVVDGHRCARQKAEPMLSKLRAAGVKG